VSLFDKNGRRQAGSGKSDADKVAAYGHGRVCAYPGCSTLLSSYNPSTFCALHEKKPAREPARPRAAPHPPRECVCAYEGCSRTFLSTNPRRRYCSDRCRLRAFVARNARAAGPPPSP
jgi:hypothetical protein